MGSSIHGLMDYQRRSSSGKLVLSPHEVPVPTRDPAGRGVLPTRRQSQRDQDSKTTRSKIFLINYSVYGIHLKQQQQKKTDQNQECTFSLRTLTGYTLLCLCPQNEGSLRDGTFHWVYLCAFVALEMRMNKLPRKSCLSPSLPRQLGPSH